MEPLDRIPKLPFDSGPCCAFRAGAVPSLAYLAPSRASSAATAGRSTPVARRGVRGEASPPAGEAERREAVTPMRGVRDQQPDQRLGEDATKQAPYRTSSSAAALRAARCEGVVLDTADPYHDVRIHSDRDGTMC